jgi:hypothetical protein
MLEYEELLLVVQTATSSPHAAFVTPGDEEDMNEERREKPASAEPPSGLSKLNSGAS